MFVIVDRFFTLILDKRSTRFMNEQMLYSLKFFGAFCVLSDKIERLSLLRNVINNCKRFVKVKGALYQRDNSLKESQFLLIGGSPVYFEGVELPHDMVRQVE